MKWIGDKVAKDLNLSDEELEYLDLIMSNNDLAEYEEMSTDEKISYLMRKMYGQENDSKFS